MRKFNTLTRWPNIHICVLDLECWCELWLYGAPMRVHYKKKHWTIPGPLLWISDWRNRKMWAGATPVEVTGPPASPGRGLSTESPDIQRSTQESPVVGG